MRRRTAATLAVALVAVLGGCAGFGTTPESSATETPTPDAGTTPTEDTSATATATPMTPVSTPGSDYETTTVDIVDANGTRLAAVDVWVADDIGKRYTGLSDTSALRDGQGMLFVFGGESTRTFVMRDMAFPLDMVFVDADGTITTIHHAPLPEDGGGDLKQYAGRAKYVLEVPMGYTNETGVEVGDRVVIDDE